MKQLISLSTAALLLRLFLPVGHAAAQTANDQFKGSSWRLISAKVERGGKIVHLIAPGLQGFLMFDSNDHFLVAITRSGLHKSGQAGTLGGSKAALQRSITCFGTYSINDADRTINVHIEGSTFPKWTGTDQKRLFTVTGDKLKWTNSAATGAAGTAELVWQRVR
jgi:Lipocalin-like domain